MLVFGGCTWIYSFLHPKGGCCFGFLSRINIYGSTSFSQCFSKTRGKNSARCIWKAKKLMICRCCRCCSFTFWAFSRFQLWIFRLRQAFAKASLHGTDVLQEQANWHGTSGWSWFIANLAWLIFVIPTFTILISGFEIKIWVQAVHQQLSWC